MSEEEAIGVEWLRLLQSSKRLEREKGLSQLKGLVESGEMQTEEERRERERQVLDLVASLGSPWEAVHGGLMALAVLLPSGSEELQEKLREEVPLLLEHPESRVRISTGT